MRQFPQHARLGQAVTALVQLRAGAEPVGADQLVLLVRSRLAGYKAPRRVVFVDSLDRAPTGKLHYPTLVRRAEAALAD